MYRHSFIKTLLKLKLLIILLGPKSPVDYKIYTSFGKGALTTAGVVFWVHIPYENYI
jgi:hypothetical protein